MITEILEVKLELTTRGGGGGGGGGGGAGGWQRPMISPLFMTTTTGSSSSQRFVIRQCKVNSLYQFLSALMWSLRFSFFWSCVCHYTRFTTLRTRPVNIDRKQTLFLDARPFDSLHLSRYRLSSYVSV